MELKTDQRTPAAGELSVVGADFRAKSLTMLESVGPLGDVMGKLNQVHARGDTSLVRFEVIEIIEAVILALVAVATAWSGYQAAKWAGMRAENYAKASRLRVTAEGLATLAGQERIYDSDTFNSWLAAKLDGKDESGGVLRAALSRRVSPRIHGLDEAPILSTTRKRLRARSSCPSTTTPSTSSSLV